MPQLTGKRVLVIGAETDLGATLAVALAEAGATLALVSTRSDADAAFAVQRLARKVSAATSQAIDGTNEAAVRVMVRQTSKAIGGLDAVVVCASDEVARTLAQRLGEREMARTGGGLVVMADDNMDVDAALAALPPTA